MCIRDSLSNPEELKGLAETGLQEEAVTFTFSPVWTGFVNLDYGFRFQFPEEWIGQVDVTKESDRSEWVFTPVSYTHLDVYKRQPAPQWELQCLAPDWSGAFYAFYG